MAIRKFLDVEPQVHETAYVDEQASVIGRVRLVEDVSVWPMAVLRGDIFYIKIGARTNIQDNSVLHVVHDHENCPGGLPVIVGEDVTIAHGAVLHGCTIGNMCLIGMNATVLDGAVIEDEVIVGANSLVPPKKKLEKGFLYFGNPVKKIRPLKPEEIQTIKDNSKLYVDTKNQFLETEKEK